MIRFQGEDLGRSPGQGHRFATAAFIAAAAGVVMFVAGGCGGPGAGLGDAPDGSATAPSNLLLIVIDTLRADHVESVDGKVLTPSLELFADRGVRFRRAYSHIPVTGPSHASIFTGMVPPAHGVTRNAQALDGSLTTIAEVLSARGFRTGGIVSLGVMASKFGFGQGFEIYDDTFELQWFRQAEEITDSALAMIDAWPTKDRFFAFVHYSDPHEPYAPPGIDYPELDVFVDGIKIERVRTDGLGVRIPLRLLPGHHEIRFEGSAAETPPTLVFQQLKLAGRKSKLFVEQGWRADAGTPPLRANQTVSLPATLSAVIDGADAENVESILQFFVTEKLTTELSRERYRLEVEYVDRQIGRLLDRLQQDDRLSDTVVIITSDHGEGLGDHGLLGHIHQLYDTLIRVPLIVVAPGIPRASVDGDLVVRHVDLRPTILSLLDVEDPVPGVGVDLAPFLRGGELPLEMPHLCTTYKPLARADLRGLVVGSRKLIREEAPGTTELYDLVADPEELNDLVGENPDAVQEVAELSAILDHLLAMAAQASMPEKSEKELTKTEKEMLEALGYVSD